MSEDQNKALDEMFGIVSSEPFEYELPAKDELIKNTLLLNKAGDIVNSQGNATDMVMAEPALQGRVRRDLFSGRTFIDLPIDSIKGLDKMYGAVSDKCVTVDLEDSHVRAIHYHLEKEFRCKVEKTYVDNGLAQLASQNEYDAAIDYFEECVSLAEDDLSGFAEDQIAYHLGIPERMLTSEDVLYIGHVFQRFLTGMVVRTYIPGYKHDWCLTLPGAQGVGKSSLLKILAGGPQFFKDDLPADLKSKDAKQGLRGVLIAEMAEFTQNRKEEQEVFKAFVTTQEDRFRPAYGKYDVVVPRRTMFAITTNKQSFLKDPSGARRIVIIPNVGEAGQIDLKWFKEKRSLILAPIVRRVKEAIESGNTEGLSLLEPRFEQLSKKIALQYMEKSFYHEVVYTACMNVGGKVASDITVQCVWDQYIEDLGLYNSVDAKKIKLDAKDYAGIKYALECYGYRQEQRSATRRSQNWFPTDLTYEYLGVKKVVAEQPNDEDDDDIPF